MSRQKLAANVINRIPLKRWAEPVRCYRLTAVM
jgi:hypothetical protein